MAYIYDIILAMLVITFFISGMQRGLSRSVISLVGGIASVFLAGFLASYISEWIFDSFIRQNVINEVSNVLQDTIGQDVRTRSQAVLEIFPPFVSNVFAYYGVNAQSIDTSILETSQNATLQVVNMVSPIIINLIRTIVFVILLSTLSFIVRAITRTIGRVTRMPVIRQVDSLLGGGFGLFKCALFISVFCSIMYFVIPMLSNPPQIFSERIPCCFS